MIPDHETVLKTVSRRLIQCELAETETKRPSSKAVNMVKSRRKKK